MMESIELQGGMMKRTFRYLLMLLLLALAPPASALCICTCTVSATGISFGAYNPFASSDVDAAGSVTFSCSGALSVGDVNYTIALSPGHSGNVLARMMDNTGDTSFHLNYNMYTASPPSTVWGDGSGGTIVSGKLTVPLLGTDSDTYTVYGRIPGGTQPTAHVGSYSDTITVTVTFSLL
jgi:spore coat protein U-like protein